MIHIGRRWLVKATGIACTAPKSLVTLYTATRRPLIVESYHIGNASAATSAQVETVWRKETGGSPTTGTGITPIALDGGGGSPDLTAEYGVTTDTYNGVADQSLRAWASVYGLDYQPPSPGQWLWLPAGATPNIWSLVLLNTPGTTFNADIEVVIQEVDG